MVRKSQSAMEYLMTYGWAILAIAIVMVSLYSLGIFNTGSLQPIATPGSCEVVRTAAQTSLAGQCSNLIPKYVGKFNGVSSNVTVMHSPSMDFVNSFTVIAWINPSVVNTYNEFVVGSIGSSGTSNKWKLGLTSSGQLRFDPYNSNGTETEAAGGSFSRNTWYQVAATFSNVSESLYINGAVISTVSYGSESLSNVQNPIKIGQDGGNPTRIFNGSIANVQVYNTSLDNLSIKTSYQEGIGGAPVDLQHLVAWWPLNGNANDYSGNNRHGTPTNVTWNANWQGGYTAPST